MRTLPILPSIVLSALTLACEPGQLPSLPIGAPGSQESTSASRDPSLVSLDEAEALRIYYQFTDERGRVRFVSTLAEVPVEWRDRVGFVEMASPPPMSPSDARRIRETRMARMPSLPRAPGGSAIDGGSAASDPGVGGSQVVMYSADWCGACRSAKRYMQSENIAFVERDVDDPEWKQEMIAKAGPGGIPVFEVNGQILRGFSPDRLAQLIRDAS